MYFSEANKMILGAKPTNYWYFGHTILEQKHYTLLDKVDKLTKKFDHDLEIKRLTNTALIYFSLRNHHIRQTLESKRKIMSFFI